jgi:hypothetical protein
METAGGKGIALTPHQLSARSAGWKPVDWNLYGVSALAGWGTDQL